MATGEQTMEHGVTDEEAERLLEVARRTNFLVGEGTKFADGSCAYNFKDGGWLRQRAGLTGWWLTPGRTLDDGLLVNTYVKAMEEEA